MKFRTILLVALMATATLRAATIDVNGVARQIDTLEHYVVGPGVTYTRFTVNINRPLNCYMLTIDMKNPHNRVEAWQAQDQVGRQEAQTALHSRLSTEGHRAIGSVNGNFWIVSTQATGTYEGCLGIPFSGNARNGVLIGEPSEWNRGRATTDEGRKQEIGFCMVDTAGRVLIDDMSFDGRVTIGDQSYALRDVDRPRVNPNADELVLFNHYLGKNATRLTDGIEVVFQPEQWGINQDLKCRVTAVNTTGGTLLTEGMGALQGRGTGKTFLSALKEGDEFTMNLGLYASLTGERPIVEQMITGNCLVMKNGELTIRNTNEEYNNRNYPRTGLATTAGRDTLFMMVMETPGMYTADMCGIFRSCGAVEAAGLDGGGSAQMCLMGKLVNYPNDGRERAVANGMIVFSEHADDESVAGLRFRDFSKVDVAAYAAYTPRMIAYNQYDALIDADYEDYTLTVTPSTLGKIVDGGRTFVAGASEGVGTLTATHGSASTTLPIQVRGGSMSIRLDSVLTDRRPYAIEVNSTLNGNTLQVDPAALTWTVEDESVCSVTDGVLTGLTNGRTRVLGTLNSQVDTLIVNVEIPTESPMLWERFDGRHPWKVTCSSGFGAELAACSDAPDAPTCLRFTYKTTRAPFVKLNAGLPLFGLPDTIHLAFNSTAELSGVIVGLKANEAATPYTSDFPAQTAGQDVVLSVPVAELLADAADRAHYPLWLNYVTFNIGNTTAAGEQTIRLDGISLCYGNYEVTREAAHPRSALRVYPNPAGDFLNVEGAGNVEVWLVDLQGHLIYNTRAKGDVMHLPTAALAPGTYLLRVNNEVVKITKK